MPLIRPPNPSSNPHTKQLPTLAECPRTSFVAGINDWLQITSPKHFPDLDICRECFNTSFRNTRYEPCLSLASPKPDDVGVKCDFSDLWIRIAYTWLFAQNAPDLTLMGDVAETKHDEDGGCPNLDIEDEKVKGGGKGEVTRTWYCLNDPKTASLVEELTVCSDCVVHLNLIFPSLNGIFCPVANGQKLLATCDFMNLGDSKDRCLEYLDRIIEVAEKSIQTGARDVTSLVTYIRKWAPIPPCKKSATITGEKKFEFSNIPELTICEECYTKHIEPVLTQSPPTQVLSHIQTSISTTSAFTCDLYSPRLQQYFNDALRTNDIPTYRQKLTARNEKLQEIERQLDRMRHEHEQLKVQSEMHLSMMQMSQVSAMTTSLAWTTGGWHAPPTDFSASNAQMAQGHEAALKAAMVLDNMMLLEKEWSEYWE